MGFPLFVGVLCLSLFCYALLCAHLSFAIILKRRRKLVALLFVLQMYCYYICPVALPHGAVGWSAVCDCGISNSYSLFGIHKNPSLCVSTNLHDQSNFDRLGQFNPLMGSGNTRTIFTFMKWIKLPYIMTNPFLSEYSLNYCLVYGLQKSRVAWLQVHVCKHMWLPTIAT